MLNENAIANAFAVTVPPVATAIAERAQREGIKIAPTTVAKLILPPVDPALAAKRDAKVEAIVRQFKPGLDEEYAKPRYAKGQPVGTMVRKVRGYFLDLYRASHPTAKVEETVGAVNSLIQGALDRGVIWTNIGGGLAWFYSSAEYPKPVSKAVLAQAQAKAEAAEIGW